MIYGLGIDIIEISRLSAALKRWGNSFIDRIFTSSEKNYCQKKKDSLPHFAVRFAAKEAFLKALRLPFPSGIGWKDIEITNSPQGIPTLNLFRKAEAFCQERKIKNCALSLSHQKEYGIAIVLLEV